MDPNVLAMHGLYATSVVVVSQFSYFGQILKKSQSWFQFFYERVILTYWCFLGPMFFLLSKHRCQITNSNHWPAVQL